jgi:broad specificity phosphatase PhoE
MRILLVRHAQTTWNRHHLIQGHQRAPLSSLGCIQAQRLGWSLMSEPLVAVYSSDLRRAVDTATIAVLGRELKVRLMPGLRECGYGDWEGLSAYLDDQRTRQPESAQNAVKGQALSAAKGRGARPRRVGRGCRVPYPEAAPGGETLVETLQRFEAVINTIAERHPGETALVVSHDGPIRAWLTHILGWSIERAWDIEIANCGITEVEVGDGRTRLVSLGGKLKGLSSRAMGVS